MSKKNLINRLITEKTKNYTYTIAFFLVFSFFVYFVIRPNLLSVFVSNSKIDELKKIDRVYENQINKVIDLQSVLESNRDNFGLLKEAVSENPQVNKVLSDISLSAEKNKLLINKIIIGDINLRDSSKQKLYAVSVNLDLRGNFASLMSFVKELNDQRRLKLVKKMTILKEDEKATESAELKINMEVEGYYL